MTQKEAPAAAAILVGIGLLAAPFESAQAQVLSSSHITGITLNAIDGNRYYFRLLWNFH